MNRSRGFTLIELLVTLVIVATLASVALPLAEVTYKREKEHELHVALRTIRQAIDEYKRAFDEGRISQDAGDSGYPHTLLELVNGVPDARSLDHRKIYFLRRLPRNPMIKDTALAAEKTWGLRCYESPPDAPAPGKDVYDVYVLSNGVGLNGIPYRQW